MLFLMDSSSHTPRIAVLVEAHGVGWSCGVRQCLVFGRQGGRGAGGSRPLVSLAFRMLQQASSIGSMRTKVSGPQAFHASYPVCCAEGSLSKPPPRKTARLILLSLFGGEHAVGAGELRENSLLVPAVKTHPVVLHWLTFQQTNRRLERSTGSMAIIRDSVGGTGGVSIIYVVGDAEWVE